MLDYRNYLEMEVEVNRGSDGGCAQNLALCRPVRRLVPVCRSGDGGTKLGR